MKQLILLLTTFSTFATGLRGADPIPLEMGSTWIYEHRATGETFTIRVGQPVWTQSGKRFHYLSGYAASPVIARIDEDGNLTTLDPETGVEQLLTGFAQRPGELWDAPKRECPQQGQVQQECKEYLGPAGAWNRAITVQYSTLSCGDTGTVEEVFAGNVGLLRRVVTTAAGPKTFDLVYARIGGQIIETIERARFSVSLSTSPERGKLRATLRIDIGYQPVIRLRFASAQVFDLALRDKAGKVAWQWSENRLFEPGERDIEIANVWSEVVDIPQPSGNLDGYTIEGWLTTAPGAAKFAATVPLSPVFSAGSLWAPRSKNLQVRSTKGRTADLVSAFFPLADILRFRKQDRQGQAA